MKFLLDYREAHDHKCHLYQKALYLFVRRNKKCCVWVDMGLGKTRPTAAVIADVLNAFNQVSRVMVIGPKRVVEEAWPEELQKWHYSRHLKFQVLTGGRKGVHDGLRRPGIDIDLISYDMAGHVLSAGLESGPGMVVLDESQYIVNPTAKRSLAAELICAEAERVVLLTGTPAANGYHQVYNQIRLVDGGKRLGRTQKAFLRRWFDTNQEGKPVAKPGAKEDIQNRIKDVCFTLLSEDYIQLPPLIVNDVKVNLSTKEKKAYDDFEKKSILELADGVQTITASSVTGLYAKLTQFANGNVYDEYKTSHVVHDEKINALAEILDGHQGENVLVMYTHVCDRERIMRAHPQARWLKTTEDVRAWKRGEISLALAHPSSIAVGLNMQSGGRIMVWYGMIWNLGNYLQCIKRLWRQGQKKPVIMHRILCQGTIDLSIARSLERKNKTQYGLMSAMKHRIEDVLGRKIQIVNTLKKKAA